MLRQLGMSNLPGIKMVPVSSAASRFWSAGIICSTLPCALHAWLEWERRFGHSRQLTLLHM